MILQTFASGSVNAYAGVGTDAGVGVDAGPRAGVGMWVGRPVSLPPRKGRAACTRARTTPGVRVRVCVDAGVQLDVSVRLDAGVGAGAV